MEQSAHATLRLRAFYRILKRGGESALAPYYSFCNGDAEVPYDTASLDAWDEAGKEALQLTLGESKDNKILDDTIRQSGIGPDVDWVLIGGPPCQAYSLVGRSRNRGKKDYRPEDDHRHFLYREYLRIIRRYRPSVFVMENVKGILSSSVNGQKIFHSILSDLARSGYRIHSLSTDTHYNRQMDPDEIDARDFIVRAEDHGIPQARHRVILVGVRDDLDVWPRPLAQVPKSERSTVSEAIGKLPKLRSRISKGKDDDETWLALLAAHLKHLAKESAKEVELRPLSEEFGQHARSLIANLSTGGLRTDKYTSASCSVPELRKWYGASKQLKVWLNHEARGHMQEDLRRYVYAAAFAETYGHSPKGHEQFSLPGLKPNHENWETGKFSDRFRVQIANDPATTVTSHIAKDGHYFIHYDPKQCRSLTVREAARLQTFPDDYFFKGSRTQQYHQVGNAVPPLLAKKIADTIAAAISEQRVKSAA
ncbi:hypothetical protein LMG19282_03001 [Cupriavidus campinensis]|nr:hypothetical protein LMG19282_03001 [Cupriavidus campinensis]